MFFKIYFLNFFRVFKKELDEKFENNCYSFVYNNKKSKILFVQNKNWKLFPFDKFIHDDSSVDDWIFFSTEKKSGT